MSLKQASMEIQSLIFSKSDFTKDQAVKWAKDHDFRSDKVDETENSYRLRQFEPGECTPNTERTVPITTGLTSVMCKRGKSVNIEKRHLVIPIVKENDGSYRAILSDDSLDRDNEFISPDIMKAWGKDDRSLPLLINHENKMQSFVGAWTDRKILEKNGHVALSMKPNFFSAQANPVAQQVKRQIEEALTLGLNPGVSIGFISRDGHDTGSGFMHTNAELLEASVVPIQSNRHAYLYNAKKYDMAESFKNGYPVICVGVDMTENAQTEVKNENVEKQELPTDVESRLAKLEQMYSEMAGKYAELMTMMENKKPTEDEQKKLEEMEKKLNEKLETTSKELEAIKTNLNQPKSKVPTDFGVNKGPVELDSAELYVSKIFKK